MARPLHLNDGRPICLVPECRAPRDLSCRYAKQDGTVMTSYRRWCSWHARNPHDSPNPAFESWPEEAQCQVIGCTRKAREYQTTADARRRPRKAENARERALRIEIDPSLETPAERDAREARERQEAKDPSLRRRRRRSDPWMDPNGLTAQELHDLHHPSRLAPGEHRYARTCSHHSARDLPGYVHVPLTPRPRALARKLAPPAPARLKQVQKSVPTPLPKKDWPKTQKAVDALTLEQRILVYASKNYADDVYMQGDDADSFAKHYRASQKFHAKKGTK